MGKKKVAIITIISRNYGNRLQNYALQKVVENIGFQVETVPMNIRNNQIYTLKLAIKYLLKPLFPQFNSICWDMFDLKIHWAKVTTDDKRISDKYDYFIAGSDQIWNPLFDFNTKREILFFAKPDQRMAYAASFGINVLPEKCKKDYSDEISKFRFISVREFAGAKIIYDLIQRQVPVVLDPTMLLSADEWINLSRKHKRIKLPKKYVVKYFLGTINEHYDNFINYYADSNNYTVIDILQPPVNMVGKIGPKEFINIIANSYGVFTDSFHGTVFSILFHKPFFVFDRPYEEGYGKMNSRLDTLLSMFDFETRRISKARELETTDFECNFDNADRILALKKQESITYLRDALNILLN